MNRNHAACRVAVSDFTLFARPKAAAQWTDPPYAWRVAKQLSLFNLNPASLISINPTHASEFTGGTYSRMRVMQGRTSSEEGQPFNLTVLDWPERDTDKLEFFLRTRKRKLQSFKLGKSSRWHYYYWIKMDIYSPLVTWTSSSKFADVICSLSKSFPFTSESRSPSLVVRLRVVEDECSQVVKVFASTRSVLTALQVPWQMKEAQVWVNETRKLNAFFLHLFLSFFLCLHMHTRDSNCSTPDSCIVSQVTKSPTLTLKVKANQVNHECSSCTQVDYN